MTMGHKKALMVGYLESWGSISMADATKEGYNTIVFAFGTIDGTNVGIFQNSFGPANNPQTWTIDIHKFREDVLTARDLGAENVLLSFGGQNNTYNPNNADVAELSKNIVSFLKQYGFNGIDFDLEINTNSEYLNSLIKEIKTIDSSLIITAAPQLNYTGRKIEFVTTGRSTDYNTAIKNGVFDYLFVQAYNTGNFKIDGFNETDPQFIKAGFHYLKRMVPSKTKIVMGEPANADAAGDASVFHGNTPINEIYPAMASNYSAIKEESQFGGIMAWDINYDSRTHFTFVQAMKSIIEE